MLPCFMDTNQQQPQTVSEARRGTETCYGIRTNERGNGSDERTAHESLLPNAQIKRYSGCEVISLEATTNLTKDLECKF